MADLLEKLKEFYKEDPSDPFNIYALAIEYLKSDLEKAEFYFEELLANYPEYIATYYHAAALFLQKNQFEKAEETFKKGIEMAQRLNKAHAFNELKRAYQAYLDEEYE
jgi:tetratricopeptide (TPR) repeat protein